MALDDRSAATAVFQCSDCFEERPEGSKTCPECGSWNEVVRRVEHATVAQTSDWFSVQAGFWRTLWLVLRGGRLRELKWLTGDEVRASGVYLSDEEFFASLKETT